MAETLKTGEATLGFVQGSRLGTGYGIRCFCVRVGGDRTRTSCRSALSATARGMGVRG
jgi:hypothetical protein